MKKYSPDIFKTKILGEKTAVICGPNGHKFLYANEQKLFTAFRPHSTQRLLRSYQNKSAAANPSPPALVDHGIPASRQKIISQPGFLKPDALARELGKMDLICQQLLKTHWEGKHEVNVFPLAKMITLTISCRFLLGVDDPEPLVRQLDNFDSVSDGLSSIILNVPGTTFYRANKAAAALRKELLGVIRERREAMAAGKPMRGLLSHMIVFTDLGTGKRMPDAVIADNIMGMVIAGFNTVASAITFLMKNVGERPLIYNKIRAGNNQFSLFQKNYKN